MPSQGGCSATSFCTSQRRLVDPAHPDQGADVAEQEVAPRPAGGPARPRRRQRGRSVAGDQRRFGHIAAGDRPRPPDQPGQLAQRVGVMVDPHIDQDALPRAAGAVRLRPRSARPTSRPGRRRPWSRPPRGRPQAGRPAGPDADSKAAAMASQTPGPAIMLAWVLKPSPSAWPDVVDAHGAGEGGHRPVASTTPTWRTSRPASAARTASSASGAVTPSASRSRQRGP